MAESSKPPMDRRKFLKRSAIAAGAAAMVGTGAYFVGSRMRTSRSVGKKVIVIGIDGMDPRLCETMINEGLLPNLKKLAERGGYGPYCPLGTSIPPQSPVAWANFINGAGPGSHGIFDFMHRHPEKQSEAYFSAAEPTLAQGSWDVGDHKLQLDFWPFNHKPPTIELKRQGVPFWNFLDEKGIPSTFYDLPSNFPASPSTHGHHRCICGMGTPDMLGNYQTYQHYATNNDVNEANPGEPVITRKGKGSGLLFNLKFENETAKAHVAGPVNTFLAVPRAVHVDFEIHRDLASNAAVIDIQGQRVILKQGQWSKWVKVDFEFGMPRFLPNEHRSGICRFFLDEVQPNFKLYLSPININPADPALPMSEPAGFIKDVSKKLGLFSTLGFQEAYEARKDEMFNDPQYYQQANTVLEERFRLFQYAFDNYDDGLLYFYFSSCDLQSHFFWWTGSSEHPTVGAAARERFGQIRALYQRLDKEVIGEIINRYDSRATIIVMSDHGFGNFGRQFGLNAWLKENDYLSADVDCEAITEDKMNWKDTKAYGLGINGLYLNLKGREGHGSVEPSERNRLLDELVEKLESVTDPMRADQKVIRKVYRADKIYQGSATTMAPDLIIGYYQGYRASWDTCGGGLADEVLSDNPSAWSADHCADAEEVPGILFCNKQLRQSSPKLIDMAPSILAEYGIDTPSNMTGKNVF